MRKLILTALLGASLVSSALAESLVVGATPIPHAEILEVVKDDLKAKGFELEIKVFNDYVTPNKATDSGDLDANYFQHEPYLDEFNANNGT
ncbi:MAG: methionine ABC transporter substrate-binding protein, partial [Campylobacter sp.]|nr:methionine ABC transporter substrate-binding protein [Campylobacter sp.]